MAITININSGADFEPVSEGVHQAVLADIVDLGVVQTAFGPKEKVQFTWLTDEADETGRTKRLFKRYTKSLHEKATLRKDVKAMRGGKDIDGSSFDVESLLGAQNSLVIQHAEGNDGKVYANIIGIMKPQGKVPVAIPSDFQRKKDRPADGFGGQRNPVKAAGGGRAVAAAAYAKPQPASQAIGDDDIPF